MSENFYIKAKQKSTSRSDLKRYVSHTWVVNNIPFFLFISILAVLYIYNGHYADKLLRKISTTEKHIKELEYQYKMEKSEVIFRSKASELVKAVEPLGLKESTVPPILLEDVAKNYAEK